MRDVTGFERVAHRVVRQMMAREPVARAQTDSQLGIAVALPVASAQRLLDEVRELLPKLTSTR